MISGLDQTKPSPRSRALGRNPSPATVAEYNARVKSWEAARRRALWKTPRQVYTARYRAHLLLTELGDAITLTHARFGLSGGVTGLVTHVARDWLAGRVTIGVLA